MVCYMISVGGSGSREAEMLVHLAAVGMLPDCDLLKIYYVDADEQNGDTGRLQNAVTAYNRMREAIYLGGDSAFLATKIELKSWEIQKSIKSLSPSISNVENISYRTLAQEDRHHSAEILLDMNHPRFDQETSLEHGFYGDPSMGSAIFRTIAQTASFAENELFSSITHDLDKDVGQDVCLVLGGSVFGGTGAALFPNLGNEIRQRCRFKGLHIGGALLLPYFSIPAPTDAETDQNNVDISSLTFLHKTAAALEYYGNWQNLVKTGASTDHIFDAMWLCGYPDKDRTSDVNTDGGSDQVHRPHFVELMSAMLARSFYLNKGDLGGTDSNAPQLYTYLLDVNQNTITWDLFEPELKGQVAAFARFATLQLTLVRGMLSDRKALQNENLGSMFGRKFGVFGDAKCDISLIRKQASEAYDYCKHFLNMLCQMSQTSSPRIALVNVPAIQNVLNTTDTLDTPAQASKQCNLKVLADDPYTLEYRDFASIWGNFRADKADQDEMAMKKLYNRFYEKCRSEKQ